MDPSILAKIDGDINIPWEISARESSLLNLILTFVQTLSILKISKNNFHHEFLNRNFRVFKYKSAEKGIFFGQHIFFSFQMLLKQFGSFT